MPKSYRPIVIVFRGVDGPFHWHTVASNGKIVADSGAGFAQRDGAVRAAKKVNPSLPIYVAAEDGKRGLA